MLLPAGFWGRLPDLCLFHRFTGRPCPSCGLTRSWAALLHGQWGLAFRWHSLGPPLLAGLGGACLARAAGWDPARSRGWIGGLAGLWALHGLLRILGLLPFGPG